MKVNSRFTIRAALVLCAAGALAFGACKKDATSVPPPPPPPPPPPALPAPTNLTATAASATKITLTWAETDTNETGFRIERCSGPGCQSFAQIFATAANVVTYSDSGLTANTAYSYRVRAFNATATSDWTTAVTATTLAASAPGFVMVGAGEITSCSSTASLATAAVIDGVIAANPDAIVFTTGDNLADTVTAGASYASCFDPAWGRFKPRMRAALGQQDFASVKGITPVYDYFADKAGAPNGWYSFDLGTSWHVIVLNTSTWQHGALNLTDPAGSPNSPQNTWLAADLSANTKPCVMVISWERRFYSGTTPTYQQGNMLRIANMLFAAGVDLMVSGKDKLYSRFALSDGVGAANANGFRQFIVGTGGRSLDGVTGLQNPPTLEVRDNTTQGVLKLTLNEGSYRWDFLPIAGGTFTDTGTQACH